MLATKTRVDFMGSTFPTIPVTAVGCHTPNAARLGAGAGGTSIAGLAVASKLGDMAANGLPAADLSLVLARHAAALIVAAVPLEPAARIVGVYPAFGPPDAERLAGVDAEPVERRISLLLRQRASANQLSGYSSRQSVMYLPPNTPSASISAGVSLAGNRDGSRARRARPDRTDSPAASGRSR